MNLLTSDRISEDFATAPSIRASGAQPPAQGLMEPYVWMDGGSNTLLRSSFQEDITARVMLLLGTRY